VCNKCCSIVKLQSIPHCGLTDIRLDVCTQNDRQDVFRWNDSRPNVMFPYVGGKTCSTKKENGNMRQTDEAIMPSFFLLKCLMLFNAVPAYKMSLFLLRD